MQVVVYLCLSYGHTVIDPDWLTATFLKQNIHGYIDLVNQQHSHTFIKVCLVLRQYFMTHTHTQTQTCSHTQPSHWQRQALKFEQLSKHKDLMWIAWTSVWCQFAEDKRTDIYAHSWWEVSTEVTKCLNILLREQPRPRHPLTNNKLTKWSNHSICVRLIVVFVSACNMCIYHHPSIYYSPANTL